MGQNGNGPCWMTAVDFLHREKPIPICPQIDIKTNVPLL